MAESTSIARRKWRFRAAAIIVGMLPLLLMEITLRLTGRATVNEVDDPYISVSNPVPLFQRSSDGSAYRTSDARLGYFRPVSFSASKSPDTFRIFCLGGSTVQGRPFAVETAFSSWLQLQLEIADPTRNWEVVNCGGISYASYRLLPIVEEVMHYAPDLIILYTGHNEFLEQRSYPHLTQPTAWQSLSQTALRNIRTVHLANDLWNDWTGQSINRKPVQFAQEVEAILDKQSGLTEYQRDPEWQAGVIEHFKFNITRIIEICTNHQVPLYLANPASNLGSCTPFKSSPTPDLTLADQQKIRLIQRQFQESLQNISNHNTRNAALQLAQLDPQNAAILYRCGLALMDQGDHSDAAQLLLQAKEQDICPLRILESMNQFLKSTAGRELVTLIDIQEEFASLSPARIPADNLFLDHVHPSIHGHQVIAATFFDQMINDGIIKVPTTFESQRQSQYSNHLARLSETYFQQGEIRLKGLQMWTRGQSGRVDLLIEENVRNNQSPDSHTP